MPYNVLRQARSRMPMSQPEFSLILSPLARRDLEDIQIYTLEKWGEAQRKKYAELLYDGLRKLAVNPESDANARISLRAIVFIVQAVTLLFTGLLVIKCKFLAFCMRKWILGGIWSNKPFFKKTPFFPKFCATNSGSSPDITRK